MKVVELTIWRGKVLTRVVTPVEGENSSEIASSLSRPYAYNQHDIVLDLDITYLENFGTPCISVILLKVTTSTNTPTAAALNKNLL